ncbi:MAG: tRNA (N6-threonylcarbamoyladenosine(37)-N6)-methyltransferase TrmO [Firmicutes bacterium]|nr:tRNA (N6-threonylcarbamoyladenosine(37)-N6)-methyltransferase TrmO [Bacillota bacterium]
MELRPIGVIRSPFKRPGDAPHQGRLTGETSVLEVFDEFAAGLKDVEEATHLIVLYWCHRADRNVLQTRTPHGPEVRGVFGCRSPSRPNPIAFCVAELVAREGNRLVVRGLDALDGSPLLDIKPYSGAVDAVPQARISWFPQDRASGCEPPPGTAGAAVSTPPGGGLPRRGRP